MRPKPKDTSGTTSTFMFAACPTTDRSKRYCYHVFSSVRNMWNMCLEHRFDVTKKSNLTFTTYGALVDKRLPKGDNIIGESQVNCVKYIKEIFPEYSNINCRVFHSTIKLLDTSWNKASSTLYKFDRLNDINYIESQKEKKKKNKLKDKDDLKWGNSLSEEIKPKKQKIIKKPEPVISIVETKYRQITPTLAVPEDSIKFNPSLKGSNLRRKLSEGNPYVNTNRLEDLKFIPGFKSVRDRQSFTLTDSGWSFDEESGILLLINGSNELAKIKVKNYRKLEGKIKSVSVIHDVTHRWWITFSCTNIPIKENVNFTGKSVGIDFGWENVLSLSNGVIIENPAFLRKSSKLIAQAQRRLDMWKGDTNSKKYHQAKKWLAKYTEKVKNKRLYWARDVAKTIVDEFDIIYLEDINLVKLIGRRDLERLEEDGWYRQQDKNTNKKVLDAGIGIVRNCIINKAKRDGKLAFKVPSPYTTQTCSNCGVVRGKKDRLKLKDKVHVCKKCGFEMHRDVNAANVILQRGMRQRERDLELERTKKLESESLEMQQVVNI